MAPPNNTPTTRRRTSRSRDRRTHPSNRSHSANPTKQNRRQRLRYSRLILVVFHPAIIALALMMGVLAFRVHKILNAEELKSVKPNPSIIIPQSTENSSNPYDHDPPSPLPRPPRKSHRRKREATRFFEEDDDHPMLFKYSKRAVPLTSLDDMLLDAETPKPSSECLDGDTITRLEDHDRNNTDNLGALLSEHGGACNTSDECLQLSPFIWAVEGTNEPCRKKTFLRCNMSSQSCLCQDTFDSTWDTEVVERTYQWNPLTKTCYVRPTNPCKQEVACSPGTTCRATVSISYNTPPLQRLCECIDIDLVVSAGNVDWWYCKHYWQRHWLFDMDNINKWKNKPYHIYASLRDERNINATMQGTETLEIESPNDKSGEKDRKREGNEEGEEESS